MLLVGRDQQALQAVSEECEGRGRTLKLDVTDGGAGDYAVEVCLRHFERLDVLVNNAGTSAFKALEELNDFDWQSQWELHVMAPMRLMRSAVPVMARAGWGRIVNVCSSSGKRPSQNNVAYSVTKAAELSLSRAFADQYASQGVLINAVAPGVVESELWMAPGGLADQVAAARSSTRDEVLKSTASRSPLGRFGTEQEIADVITFLSSEAASNVAGAAWSADGGAVPVII